MIGSASGKAGHGLVAGDVLFERPQVQPVGVVDAAEGIGHGDDLHAVAGQGERGDGADVAEALDGGGGFADVQPDGVGGAVDEVADAAAGGLAPAQRAAQRDRFAGDDAGHGGADVDGVGVHHPGHDLFVGAQVGGHDIHLRADERNHLLRVTAGEPLQFGLRQLAGVAGDAAFGAAVGQAGQAAFPAHPHRQRRHFAQRHVRVKAQAALGRAEGEVMLHAVAGEDLRRAVVAMNRQRDRQGALGVFDPVALGCGHLQMVGHQVELLAGHPESGMIVDFHAPHDKRIGRVRQNEKGVHRTGVT